MITFGRFGHAENIQKDKKFFLEQLNFLMYKLNDYDRKVDYKEAEIIKPLKEKLNKRIKEEESFFSTGVTYSMLSSFLGIMGLNYFNLTPKEKEEILEMDFTYDNFKIKSIELINSFKELKMHLLKLHIFVLMIFILYFIFKLFMIMNLN